eukprot:CAMPEP_0201688474 /NCGR_PEP_ID=MMETSP0578-20130828/2226_1 /ASSEMBLY_ACC=CAM_ASM_000663 /TAXON_ID=267565 /ORGANISM="Skeletonema grethea, Strain CCMP 1804" /LENGTH=139 /DNA_ID=CAMNT_0048172809 /DNA_START=52 /DNA_END=471 /DNA_ORIENTATION=-
MASFQSASLISSHLNPADASQLTGRYETVATTKHGKEVNVLRSLRHAPKEDLLLQARITPKKIQPTASDMDGLCGLFKAKMTVSPKNKSHSKFTTKDNIGEAEASAKTNVVSSPVNKRRISSRLSASAAMKAILTEDNE